LTLRNWALFGVFGPLVAYFFVILSVFLSPWFSWQDNALSDLGHAVNSKVAPIFNFGLLISGLFVLIYSIELRRYARYTGFCLLASGFTLQMIALFDEVYGIIHFGVSVLFFLLIGLASIAYVFEKKSPLALISFVIGLCSWLLFWTGIWGHGIAIPETVSSVAVTSWVASSAFGILRQERHD